MNQTSPEMISCDAWKFPGTGEQFYLIADNEGNLRANRLLSEEESRIFYSGAFDRSSYTRRGKTLQGWHRAWRMTRFAPEAHSRILDYGCGEGSFLKACRRRFPTATLVGYEMSADLCKRAADQSGARVTPDFSALATTGEDGYDLITAWGVLEHCPEPEGIIKRLYSLLKPGGTMVVMVPNRGAIGMRRMGADWAWCQAPFIHIWHFSAQGLLHLANSAAPTGVAKVSTRDCWDCNHLTDWLLHRALRLNDWRNRKMALRLDSVFRLLATVPNELLLNPFVFAHYQSGAELNLTLVKPTAENSVRR
ncbi:MAG TPA: class I SAM-dependent methyltransferase [Edaphobacter sp.]|nr:class I SAM-dependent methyltransferase [Edaphobacter sp.]